MIVLALVGVAVQRNFKNEVPAASPSTAVVAVSASPLPTPEPTPRPAAAANEKPARIPTREELRAKLLATAPPKAAEVFKHSEEASKKLNEMVEQQRSELATAKSAQAAIQVIEQCLAGAANKPQVTMPKEMADKFGPEEITAQLQLSCLQNAGNIIETYPGLREEMNAKVMSKVTVRAHEILRSRGDSLLKK